MTPSKNDKNERGYFDSLRSLRMTVQLELYARERRAVCCAQPSPLVALRAQLEEGLGLDVEPGQIAIDKGLPDDAEGGLGAE